MQLEQKEYNFKSGVTAIQKEATYKTDKKLVLLILKKFNVKDFSELKDKIKVTDLIETLMKEDILLEVMDVLLEVKNVPSDMTSEKYKADWENLTREEIIAIANDFFILSPSLSQKLGIGKSGQASQSE